MKRSAIDSSAQRKSGPTPVEDAKSTCLQTPHTLRLLKLIREGTPEYSRVALERLDITDQNKQVLWDLLGRLQEILTAPEWQTRQAAAKALEQVARTLGDGEQMWLQQDSTGYFLTIDSLDVDVILQKGRLLYAVAESNYENDEDLNQATSVKERLRLQRQLLARRLGLGSICAAVGDEILPDITTEEDMLQPIPKKIKTTIEDPACAADEALLPDSETPFRTMLVETATTQTPKTLLATELLVGVLDPVWHIRHGALLGLLSLVRAWRGAFGPFLHDALVRVLSVGTILDRFGDFGGSDAVVAPVRDMAGQLAALLLVMADSKTRQKAFDILDALGKNAKMDWEARHGVLSVYKFLVVAGTSSFNDGSSGYEAMLEDQWNVISRLSVDCLQDESDDVKSVASQVLAELVQRELGFCAWASPEPLWASLQSANEMSSSIKDLVTLFLALVEKDCPKYLRLARCDTGDVVDLLCKFLDSQFVSIRCAAMRCTGILATVPAVCSEPPIARRLVARVFESFFTPLIWGAERDETWDKICGAHTLKPDATMLASLLIRMFSLPQISIDTEEDLPISAVEALSMYLVEQEVGSLVEVAIVSALQSPSPYQCEVACLFYRTASDRVAPVSQLSNFISSSSLFDYEVPCMQTIFADDQTSVCCVCDLAFRNTLCEVANNELQPEAAVTSLLRVWKKTVLNRGSVSSVRNMRVSTSIAGAQVASGILSRATPLVRALMTALKNETSKSRRYLACKYLVEFLCLAFRKGTHEKATSKIVKNLCDAVISSNGEGLSLAAPAVLRELIKSLPPGTELVLVPSISKFVNLVVTEDVSDLEMTYESLQIVQILSSGIARDTWITPQFVSMSPSLVRLATFDKLHAVCASSLVALSTVIPDAVLGEIVPVLVDLLKNPATRARSCELLKMIIDSVESKLCPFVRVLLPAVLSVITDEDCGRNAHELFASLVRIAPLVDRRLSDSGGKSVIDHLIFGEPLPSCKLPSRVTSALESSGISLRGYQEEGVAWLHFLQNVHLSGALCDGETALYETSSHFSGSLGKTLQSLIGVALAHDSCPGRSRSIVVCPSTLVSHWASEISKYFPGDSVFRVLCLSGTRAGRIGSWQLLETSCDLVVTSYSVLRSDIDYLSDPTWCYCILDEGHLLKNPRTDTAKAARRLKSTHKLIMTGTPIQNKIGELFSVFDFLMPMFLGDQKSFTKYYASPIAKGQQTGSGASDIVEGIAKLKRLHQQVLPFLLRREKDSVLAELPPKITTVIRVPLSNIQRRVYDKFCSSQEGSGVEQLVRVGSLHMSDKAIIPPGTFKVLLYLRLLCTHPSLVLGGESFADLRKVSSSGKLLALVELLREAGFIDTDIVAADNDQSLLYCNGGVRSSNSDDGIALEDPNNSAGCLTFRKYAEEKWANQDTKCLIFAQFTKSLDIVEKCVMDMLIPSCSYVRLDGGVPPKERMSLVNKFNDDPNTRIMLLTTRVGGVGLNLTAADTIIFLEHDYNPHADLQATDRARRIGQTKVVKVYKLVAENTIDEKLLEIHEKKLLLSDAIVNTDNSTLYTMGTDRLLDIFSARPGCDSETFTDVDVDRLAERYINDYESLSAVYFAESLGK